ncbi:NADH-quinone oxidoreductase subunit K [Marinicella pacifica]|uniref:NADH-quinone oxidoreductase subunit K n=1 Tax=Marinicella pacifica TaxID=1171543 RepID=A0A917FLP1_9GAMM|nr:NADH-quinone oxidoreductase subunit NuoK [Marinicella pacifica]GGF91295.1 NADH-quinone oxidoreductase subunit K [Marinicella pacifica]
MSLTLNHYLIFSTLLFMVSLGGIFANRRNILVVLMSLELLLLSVNTNFIAFSKFIGDVDGQVFVFFILTVAAAEAAIGLAILVMLYRNKKSLDVDDINELEG